MERIEMGSYRFWVRVSFIRGVPWEKVEEQGGRLRDGVYLHAGIVYEEWDLPRASIGDNIDHPAGLRRAI